MRTSSKSMIVVVAGLGLVALGFLGYRKMVSKKENKRTEETPQPSVEASKTENVNDAKISQEPEKVENVKKDEVFGVDEVDKLVKEIIISLLNKECEYKGHDHFMSEFIRISFKNIIDPRWYEKLPKDTNEMIVLIKTYGINTYRLYERKVLGINNGLGKGGKKKKYSTLIYRRTVNTKIATMS